jgi:hypothetical protein
MELSDDLLSDDLTAEALDELVRLAREAVERFADRRYLEVLASLSAMEPLKAVLIEQCSDRWTSGPRSVDANVLSFGYV